MSTYSDEDEDEDEDEEEEDILFLDVDQFIINKSKGCEANPPTKNNNLNYQHTGEDDAIMVDLDICTDGEVTQG